MAFDLNKNNGADPDSSGKKSASSKFDLSKGKLEGADASVIPSKSKNVIIGLAGLLIVGGGIWYYNVGKNTETTDPVANSTSVETRPSDTTLAVPTVGELAKDSPAAVENTPAVPVENTTAVPVQTSSVSNNSIKTKLNHKIPATFAQGSAAFNQIDQSLIKGIVSYLTENPDASIQINGYASSDGTLEINQTVSQARADAFKKYLISKNIAEDRVLASGKGIENPIASNGTNAGRKKNRRVEIIFP
ncbi:OmpA family protein [Pedobacter sp. FW305-3-2-15-E-R2A2]|uniref:OmpA family protein n=1 Tax=Pedobacter sp. FW305-3-2-15-E-R2A2 TaxID=3140251 RepID=UPI00314023D3